MRLAAGISSYKRILNVYIRENLGTKNRIMLQNDLESSKKLERSFVAIQAQSAFNRSSNALNGTIDTHVSQKLFLEVRARAVYILF